ncbi:MAG: GTP-binding protein [Candidatus Colwellbacteria bacterium]|nr:GTP-binding protein [Candidatus Colwellbacteria bacterium]
MPATDKKKSNLQRPPVVAIVGHVDHGKTTLLDYIRKTSVAAKEAGGITQSIGAYEVEHSGKKITFIDTPGHEAFSLMRARGAAAADLAILVVAADDGVKPQTSEAIEILKTTETPFIVTITKIDSPNANIDKVKNELLGAEVLLEGYGGNISWHGVSGITGEGVSELLDLIILTGEIAELTFNPEGAAEGFVIEARKDSRRGIIAHLVLKDGTLKVGDLIATPTSSGRVKILEDFLGRRVKELQPSAPALVVGFEKIPRAGEEFTTDKITPRVEVLPVQKAPSEKTEGEERLKVVLKADTAGSLEAMEALLGEMVEVIESAVGEISDNDVKFAKSTGSAIVGFKVMAPKSAIRLADAQKVKIITADVIYRLVDTITEATKAEEKEKIKGTLEVLAVFSVGSAKKTVGGKVIEGALRVGNQVEIEHGMEVIGRGKIVNLQQDKEDTKEIAAGKECGLVIETSSPIEVGDTLRTLFQ